MKKKVIIILCSVFGLALLAYIITFLYACSAMIPIIPRSKRDDNIENYMNTGQYISDRAAEILPDLNGLPKYKDIEYRYYMEDGFFDFEIILLVVKYDEQTYDNEREKLDNQYAFLDHIVSSNGWYLMPEYEFSINDYDFRVIDRDMKDSAEYPRNFGMVATSDENSSIAYIYVYDPELDSLGELGDEHPVQDYLEQYIKYDW